jgi:RNA polymerase sigma-70 factor, ECF subfamily
MVWKKSKINDEDSSIVDACKKGNVDAFEILVRKYQNRMFNIAFRMVGNYEDACEVVQDTFVSTYKNIRRFKGQAKFSTWLSAIVINHSKNRLKKLRSRFHNEPYSIDDPIPNDPTGNMKSELKAVSNEPSSQDQLERKTIQEHVQKCIDTISEGFKEVLVLRDIQGFAYVEISEILNIPEGTVKSKLFRARDVLKNCLKKVLGDL